MRDLAIFGFFIALGRRTQVFLRANGFDALGDPIESFIRYVTTFNSPLVYSCLCALLTCFFFFFMLQVSHRRQCFILSSTFINKFLSVVCGGLYLFFFSF